MKYELYTVPAHPSNKSSEHPDCMPLPEQDFSLAMAYVPVQNFGQTYEVEEAWSNGTLFPDLNKPFLRGGRRK